MSKRINHRITRADQAWGPAHREQLERGRVHDVEQAWTEALAIHDPVTGTTCTPYSDPARVPNDAIEPLQEAPLAPRVQSLTLPLSFVTAALLISSKDDIRYYLNGIFVHEVGGEIRVCATDGHRLIVSRFVPAKGQRIPKWAKDGIILPRNELAQAMPIFQKNASVHEMARHMHPAKSLENESVTIELAPGSDIAALRTANGFASFRMKLVEGKFPDYARVLAGHGANLARGEGDAMRTSTISAAYIKSAADVASKLGARAINSFLGQEQSAALFTFDGAPDTVLIIMSMRGDAEQVSDGVIRLLGPEAMAASISALKAHSTRTVKLLGLAKSDKERESLEARKQGFEERIQHLRDVIAGKTSGVKQLEHKREAA
jgi:hypothetical protein